VIYRVELQDDSGEVLDTVTTITQPISFDVSSIVGDYIIKVLSSYDIEGSSYTDQVLYSYSIYNNEYATFFAIPTLTKIDTSLPLTSYDQYKDYLYTYMDQGITQFTIECDDSLDCTTLVEDPTYSGLPFDVSGFLHPYSAINMVSFSYNTSQVRVTTTLTYSETDIDLINTEVQDILNTIITESMTTEEKIQAVHDYIINNAYYDTACYDDPLTCDNDHTALGILFDGNAVCEGYAHLTDIMLRALRIPSFRISSDTHQWNGVYVNDQWLHLDTTWDDPVTQNHQDILRYDYFLITTAELHALDTTSHTYDTTLVNFMN